MIHMTLSMAEKDASPVIEQLIREAQPGEIISFEPGVYPLMRAVEVRGKRGLTLEGQGCVLAPRFNREAPVEENAEVFHFTDCQNVTLRGFDVCSDMPVNSACTILGVTPEYADIQVDSRAPFTGKEMFISGMSYDAAGVPTYCYWIRTDSDPQQRTVIAGEIACTNPRVLDTPHKMIGDQVIRVWSKGLEGLEAGMRCSVQHSYYGIVAFTFRQCVGFTFEDVRLSNFGGFGFAILPRCRDFTFRRLKFQTHDPVHQPMALNSDGIHLTGLSGKLLLEDCDFDLIGDDFYNVHTQVMVVSEAAGDRMRVVYDKPHGIVPQQWAMAGDCIRVYDPDTLEMKCQVAIKEFTQGEAILDAPDAPVAVGDFVVNQAYFPDVVIRHCTTRNCRGRASCLQSVNSLLMEDCLFENVHCTAAYCSTAFDFWREAGPVRNVIIRNNRFVGNGKWIANRPEGGAIYVRVNGERHQKIPPVHQNIRIENNVFQRVAGIPIVVNLADAVRITGNVFDHCRKDGENIVLAGCTHVRCDNNHAADTAGEEG